jgi:deazaflavin-dependent oxidoreductase (nitroreductase family)
MTDVRRSPGFIWRIMRFLNRHVMPKTRPEVKLKGLVLLLTTTGRKSGLPRQTRLQYEEQAGVLYVAAARGQDADWFRNIVANPHVEAQINERRFHGVAEPITDPARIADFLELRLQRHPQMVGAMLLLHGLPMRPHRANLEQLAAKLALVAIRPDESHREGIKQCEE